MKELLQQQNILVDSNDVDQRFMLTDVRADTSTLTVKVQNSTSDTTTTTYTKATDITQLQKLVQFIIYKKLKVVSLKFTLEMVQQVSQYQMVIL